MAEQPVEVRIFHNPRCSKSRQTLQLLQERNLEPVVTLYLDQPPTPSELRDLLRRLGMRPRELMRTQEPEYQALGLDDPGLGDDQLIAAMVGTPKLIERPIVVVGDKAALGRPPEQVLEILP